MRRSIATVSLSGVLADKLEAAAAAGFEGVEVFDNDLVASPLAPGEVAARCRDLGMAVELFQPVRDVEAVPPSRFDSVLHRVGVKLEVARALGAPVVLACSNASPDAVADLDLSAEQLHRVGERAEEAGVVVAYEALAWGTHVDRVAQAWDVVQRADHPAVTLAVDTFHMLVHGDGGEALAGVPGSRIGFLQVADGPVLDMGFLEWSRHFRCFPGEGALDVAGVVASCLEAGYTGPLSLEVFSDVVREADPAVTARDAMRSLVHLEDQVGIAPQPPTPSGVDPAFVEVPGGPGVPETLAALGFAQVGDHRSKPVGWWRLGDAHVVANDSPARGPALGLLTGSVPDVARRAEALLWPPVDHRRADDEAPLAGLTSPSGLHVFLSGPAGGADHWQDDFEPLPDRAASGRPPVGTVVVDHVVVPVDEGRLNEQVAFLRTLLGLGPGGLEEFMEPQGRLRSRAFRPRSGDLRLVLNVEDGAAGSGPGGLTQVALACDDVRAWVRHLGEAGVPLMPVPDNYYVDLDARLAPDPALLADLREHGLLYDRVGDGELLHAFTAPLPLGFHVEVLERRGGYDGYGSAATHVRLASRDR